MLPPLLLLLLLSPMLLQLRLSYDELSCGELLVARWWPPLWLQAVFVDIAADQAALVQQCCYHHALSL